MRERFEVAPRRHAQLLLPWAESLLADGGLSLGQLDGIAFGRGPGSFTGVRIVTGVVQGIAFGADLPVAPVSTLAALALGGTEALGAQRVVAAVDARMGELYWGCFEADVERLVRLLGEERVLPPESASLPGGAGWWGFGSGWEAYGAALAGRFGDRLEGWRGDGLPRARHVAALGARRLQEEGGVTAEAALPVYLRDRVAWQKR
ncbi:tRNA (adenosine(37)-N6)-threonylcarbamoyltransferase complex dimerization subunit type 1 TsaB [Endothiovibrio diazotrophicus]